MKFSTYTPAVKANTINARISTSVTKEAFGTDGSQLGAWSSAANHIAGIIQKRQDEDDAADIMAARNEISQKLNESLYSEDGIITTGKGKNAQGMTDRVNQSVQDVTQEVAGNYNGRVRYQLMNKYLPKDLEQYGKLGMQTENKEREAYQTDTFNARMSNFSNSMALSYADPDTVYGQMQEANETLNSWADKQGWDAATTEAKKMTFRTQTVSSLVKACVADEKYDYAYEWLKRERKNMSQDEFNSLYATVEKQKKAKDKKDISRILIGKFYNPETNELDIAGLEKEARAMCTKSNGISSDSVEAGYQKWGGKTMPHGTNGCVEAAVRILGTDNSNSWIQSIQGDTDVPTLVSKSQTANGGPGVIPYSADQVEPGDMIIYGDNDHVVVATGGTGYVGNSSSSSPSMVIRGGDYREMGGQQPSKIIKSSQLGSGGSTFDADRYEELMDGVYSLYADQSRFYNIDQKQKMQDLEATLSGCNTFEEQRAAIENSGLNAKTKNTYLNRLNKAQKQAIKAASGSSGSRRSSSGGTDRYFNSWTEEKDLSLIEEYNERLEDPDDEISDSDQKKYDAAAHRYNFHHGTGTADLNDTKVLDMINEKKNEGYSYSQIWNILEGVVSDETKEYYLRAAFSE
nr:MAG TPA: hypothetical protein [Caudoviricetes sp.]